MNIPTHATKPGFLLIDLPSKHEIVHSLSTECDVVEAILHNRGLAKRITHMRLASAKELDGKTPARVDVRFVHLAGHADKNGIGFLRGGMPWQRIAEHITRYLCPLGDERRVMVFSCCHSRDGFEATKHIFRRHFTAAYLFNEVEVDFCDAITVWAMFYFRKTVSNPHMRIVDPINEFFGDEVLQFRRYDKIGPISRITTQDPRPRRVAR